MRILFLADLHLTPNFRETIVAQLKAIRGCYQPDAVVIAGDLATALSAAEACADVRQIFEVQPMALVGGNHDYWLGDWYERQLNIEDVIEQYWRPAARQHGIVLLDETNADLGEVVITGGYGHFDFGFAVLGLHYGRYLVRMEDYMRGVTPDGSLVWNDLRMLACARGAEAEAQRQAKAITLRLDRAIGTRKPVLVATHTIPFTELNGHSKSPARRESFLNAYSGNSLVGKVIQGRTKHIDFLVCGHTHMRVDEKRIHGLRCVNLGSHYGQVRGVLYDTKTKGFIWVGMEENVETMDGEAVNTPESTLAKATAIGIRNQHKFRPEPLFNRTGKGHYDSETVKEIEETKRQQKSRAKRKKHET